MTDLNRQWVLRRRPHGPVAADDLEFVRAPMPVPAEGEALVRTLYLSLDPAQRISMSDGVQYGAPVRLGEVLRGGALAVVEESRHPELSVGDLVTAPIGWQDYAVVSAARRIADPKAPLPAYLSALGLTGAAAYFGLLDVGRPQAGETVVVSAAAGAVGSIAGQLARIRGCRVVGVAGSDAKCRHVVEQLGFDACVNYRRDDFAEALAHACPDGVDVDFENAGGTILETVLDNINLRARIALCGLISTYNAGDAPTGPRNFANVLMKRARVEGFIIGDYAPRLDEAYAQLESWIAAGELRYDVQILEGLENAPGALQLLFSGGNLGKLMLKVSEAPRHLC